MRTLHRILFVLLSIHCFTGPAAAEVVDIGPVRDAQVARGYPDINYGSTNNLYLQSSASAYMDERAWTNFDLAGRLPPGAVITRATLRLFCYRADIASDLPTSIHGSDTDDWGETAITWNNQPAYGAALSTTTLAKGKQGIWIEWDATSFVQSRYTGDQKVSLLVRAVEEGASTAISYSFDSREYTSSLAPRLRIEYTGSWPATGGFTIFHMNDVHARLLAHELDVPEHDDVPAFEEVGGAAVFAARLLQMKSANADSLVLDAGDISEGNPIGDLRGNGAMIDFYNLLDARLKDLGGRGIDAAVVGNHDVRTIDYINNLKNNPAYPVISMNVCRQGTQTPYFTPYATVNVAGQKIGILGYTNDESSYMDAGADAVVDVVKAVWEDTDPATINIKDYVNTLRAVEGCDLVILLSHIGQSRVVSGADALIEDAGGVLPPEVVVSGHWHSFADTAWKPAQLNGRTVLVEAASYLQYLGELQVTDDGQYVRAVKHPIRTAGLVPDPEVQVLVEALQAEYAAASPSYELDQVIGHSATNLLLDKDKWWTMNEFPWSGDNTAGAWICDAMAWKAGQLGFPAELALQSGGGVRRDVPAGPVTFTQIYETYPWQDDSMVRVAMTGQEIWDYIESDFCGTSISRDWLVTAADGLVSSVTYQGNPVNPSGTYNVIISEYMAAHDPAFTAKTATPVGGAIRQAVVDYTGRFQAESPMTVPGPRYHLDTEIAGGFRAVITMVDDAESEPYYEAAFVRLIEALPETVARRDAYGLAGLVNADGSINPEHQMAEGMLYRSHLGFADGRLSAGDIVDIWVEGGFHGGNPQWVDQEGMQPSGEELNIVGRDEALALPEYHAAIASFWDEVHENHLVTFVAEKTGANTVRDAAGQSITVYQPGGYYAVASLPGSVGQYLQLTGVNTFEHTARRFRLGSATLSTFTAFPPSSAVDAVTPFEQTTAPLALTAQVFDQTAVAEVSFEYRFSADSANFGPWLFFEQDPGTPYAVDFTYPAGYGHYEFRSIATDIDGNVEPAPLLADAAVRYVAIDSDNDGLADGVEDANRNGILDPDETDPFNPDTDGDGYHDGEEVEAGTDPLDELSWPETAGADIPLMGPVSYAAWASLLAGVGAVRARRRRKQ